VAPWIPGHTWEDSGAATVSHVAQLVAWSRRHAGMDLDRLTMIVLHKLAQYSWPANPLVAFPDIDPLTVSHADLYYAWEHVMEQYKPRKRDSIDQTFRLSHEMDIWGPVIQALMYYDPPRAARIIEEEIRSGWPSITYPDPPDVWTLTILEISFLESTLVEAYEAAQERIVRYSPLVLATAMVLSNGWSDDSGGLYVAAEASCA
jgi:hypothetical protein